jgi:geranylgeranyl diphosphate synthase type II
MFKDRLCEYTNLVNNSLDENLLINNGPEKKLLEAMKYSVMAGGKRLRPALILEGYRMFSNNYKKALPFACAMEMVHTFSLIHDDLPAIDNDDLRRGKPTNHKVFGESTAILAGDALLNLAYELIARDIQDEENIDNKIKAFLIFSKCIGSAGMIRGEFTDISYEGKNITFDELMFMHENKTGALIKGSLLIGAVLGGADEKALNILESYAEKIGVAFQIKDDILSETGDEKILGKPIGNDKERGKSTFATVLGINRANEDLNRITEEAIRVLKDLEKDTEFFKELAIFIKEREN